VVTNPVPTAAFVGVPTNGSAPLSVTFTNLSTYESNSVWNFGDGISVTNTTNTTVAQTYTNAGSYTVTLKVIGSGGTNSLTNTAYIVVTNPVPTVAFIANVTNGAPPLTVTFTNLSAYGTNSIWTFGDGNSVTNTGGIVSDIYTNAGSYTVVLTVMGTGGTNSLTKTAYIVVGSSSVAQFNSVVLSGGQLILSGTNGVPGATYYILTSTSVTNSLANWTPIWTNVFTASGSYSYTNSSPTNSASFFIESSQP
jgi:PKD repeat protein